MSPRSLAAPKPIPALPARVRHLCGSARLAGFLFLAGAAVTVTAALALFGQSGPAVFTETSQAVYSHENLLNPTGIWMRPTDPSHLFIDDSGHNQVKMLTLGGSVVVVAGNGTRGYVNSTTANSEFNRPTGIWGDGYVEAWDPTLQHTDVWISLYVQDTLNNVVRFICKPIIAGTRGCGADSVTTAAGNGTAGFVNGPAASSELHSPSNPGIPEPSEPNTTSLIPDAANGAIRALASGQLSTFAGTGVLGFANGYRTSAEFDSPEGITADAEGNVYVADAGNFVIRKLNTAGNVSTFAGSGVRGYADGSASNAEFSLPTAVVFDSSNGYWYVADAFNNCIRRIDSAGNVTTYAGATQAGLVNGSLADARFAQPSDIVINGSTMYVSDTGNNAIRAIDMTNGTVSTLVQ